VADRQVAVTGVGGCMVPGWCDGSSLKRRGCSGRPWTARPLDLTLSSLWPWCHLFRLFSSEDATMRSASGTRGTGSTKVSRMRSHDRQDRRRRPGAALGERVPAEGLGRRDQPCGCAGKSPRRNQIVRRRAAQVYRSVILHSKLTPVLQPKPTSEGRRACPGSCISCRGRTVYYRAIPGEQSRVDGRAGWRGAQCRSRDTPGRTCEVCRAGADLSACTVRSRTAGRCRPARRARPRSGRKRSYESCSGSLPPHV
jgi:hypothetical protein